MRALRTLDGTPSQSGRDVSSPSEAWVALIGNPNTGKTTVFNALTGGRARTGNYPGVTVDKKVGRLRGAGRDDVRLLDLPGTYSLSARSPDEMVAVDVLLGHQPDVPRPSAVVVVADATNLERNLYLVTQVMEAGLPTVVALNMVDTARRRGIGVDPAALANAMGVPVIPTVAHRGTGIPELREAILTALDAQPPRTAWTWPRPLLEAEARLAEDLQPLDLGAVTMVERRRALLDVDGEAERRLVRLGGPPVREALRAARGILEASGASAAGLESSVRYAWIGGVVAGCLERPAEAVFTRSDRIDRVLTHRFVGTAVLILVLGATFMSIFAWAAPLMDSIDGFFAHLQQVVSGWAWLGDGAMKSLVVDGVISGVGSVLIFLPQIMILFGFIALLEGCGYMARAALLTDRLMRWCGLSGRSIIPMLSSFACAVPGIMSARTIENRRDRIVTILVAPFMSCSARIPVYVILIAAFVPTTMVLGFLPLQGLVFTAMYFVGIAVAIPTAFLLKKLFFRGDRPSFLVELPPYRVPHLGVVFHRMLEQGKAFVFRAGTLIFAATILIWALSYFPRLTNPGAEAYAAVASQEAATADALARLDVERARQEQAVLAAEGQSEVLGARAREAYEAFLADAETRKAALDAQHDALEAQAEHAASAESLRHSWLGRAGTAVEPVFEPIGWDWRVSVAVLAAFPAREVVISTLGVIYQLGGDVDAESEGLRYRLRTVTWDTGPKKGERVFDLAGAIALMVFFALCAQCMSTLVTIRKETASWRWPIFSFAYMTIAAYVAAFLTAVILRAIL